MQIQISWLLQPTYLDLHCLQRQGISGLSRTRVKRNKKQNKKTPHHNHLNLKSKVTSAFFDWTDPFYSELYLLFHLGVFPKLNELTLSMLGKTVSRSQFDISFFSGKLYFTFHANCLLTICLKRQSIFSEKSKKAINPSSAKIFTQHAQQ